MTAATVLAGAARAQNIGSTEVTGESEPVVIDRPVSGQPHRGKVLALITPHLDDGPIFAGGLLAKLLSEGYTGYFIRTSNDEKDSYDMTIGETVLANERDTSKFVETAGLKKSYDLSYRNHRIDAVSKTDFRGRLIFLFRLLKVDTVLSYDPWGHYEENPDHYVTAQEVEAACWMAADRLDYPEHMDVGLRPHGVSEKYYFARGPQLVNRAVDTTTFVPKKIAIVKSCHTMIDNMVRSLNETLAERRLRLPAMTGMPEAAIDAYIREAFIARDHRIGAKYKLEYAEEYHYIGPDSSLDNYIAQNAKPL
ncbi:MAG: PIG-L family deacetylase [Acidobacteriota bacterium]